MLIRLENFAGRAPKVSNRTLPPNFATISRNAQLYSGELRGLYEPKFIQAFSEIFTVRRAYRLYDGSVSIQDAVGTWVLFDDMDVNFVRGALVNDSLDRYYFAGGGEELQVNTAARIIAESTPYLAGVPAPTVAPSVTPPATGTDETRAYVYTFVNEFGEESAPSPPSAPATGDIGGTWALASMQTAYPPAGAFNTIDKTRIYRTVTGTNSVSYRFVAELDPSAATYNDTQSIDTVSLNESLGTVHFDLPPAGLEGIVNMANGIMAGFVGRDIYFCEPYRPHSWPAEYVLSVESDVVGLGVYQSGVVICTTASPYIATGSHPASIILTKLDDVEPCRSFRSIVSGVDGVIYSSSNGLVLINNGGANNLTQPLLTRNEWRQQFNPDTIQAASDGSAYLGFNSSSVGFLLQPDEPLGYITDLSGFADIEAVQTDPFTGESYLVSDDQVLLWNPPDTSPIPYTWRSKVFETPRPVNMGAYRIQYEDVIGAIGYVPGFDYTPYNTERIASSLDPINGSVINGVEVVSGLTNSPPVIQWRNPIGGGPLYALRPTIDKSIICVKIFADDVEIYSEEITSDTMQRLPSGFKADKWQVELSSAQNIYSFNLAGTAKELATG